jgi:GNAT superfamily N-acetyltransferase
MPPPNARIRSINGTEAAALVPALSEILRDCVAGGASVNFLRPLPPEAAHAFWEGVAAEVAAGRRLLFLAEDAAGPAGTVQLVPAPQPNQPHRAEVAKLLVHRRARRAGQGAALMEAAEGAALAAGRTLLTLDTEAEGAAERLYRRLGWTPFGTVPGYALTPDGRPWPARFFYKNLAA